MFSTSPVVKATSLSPASVNSGGFVVTEQDYAPHTSSPSQMHPIEKRNSSDYGNISWNLQQDASTPHTLATPHFGSTSLKGQSSHGHNSAQFHCNESPEKHHVLPSGTGGAGFTVSTGLELSDNQISTASTTTPTGVVPPAWTADTVSVRGAPAAHGVLPAPRHEGMRREHAMHTDAHDVDGGCGGMHVPGAMRAPFARRGGYSSLGGGRYAQAGPVEHTSPYTYHGPGGDYQRNKRLHQDFKALSKEERQMLVEKEAAVTDLLERTVHLRFLPTCMRQSELATICAECGEYLRVRICGNSTSNQNWIYGFVEFATKQAAARMLEKSGMELFNGHGRPPLRLKCNAAKQPIVDRVFHDADPESNSPCIFGLGNFASRSLKDALDSYFNLKAKEQQQMQEEPHPHTPSSLAQPVAPPAQSTLSPYFGSSSSHQGGGSPQLNSMGTSITSAKLSPQAKAFVPGQGFTVSCEQLPQVDVSPGRITPMTIPAATRVMMDETSGATSSADEGSESPAQGASLHDMFHNASVQNDVFTVKDGGVPTPINLTPTTRDAPGQLLPPPAYSQSQDGSSLSSTPTIGFSTSAAKLAGAGMSPSVLMPMYNAIPSFADTALPAPVRMPKSDAEVVVQRAARMAVTGLRLAETFLRTNERFFDAVGTLRTLLDLLQRYTPLTGGPANTISRDFTAELPQKTTQLCLFANVVLALMYLGRRAFSEALPFIQAAVTVCKEIGHAPLAKPTSLVWRETMEALTKSSAAVATLSASPAAASVESSSDNAVGPAHTHRLDNAAGQTMGAFFANQTIDDMIYADMEAYLNTDDEATAQSVCSVQGREASGVAPASGASTAASEALYARDVRFHSYVWNALVALGLALEEVRPDIAHSVFNLAASQARDVLRMSCATLNTCLREQADYSAAEGGTYPRLCAQLFPEAMARSCDITTFPRLFFQKSRELPLEDFLDSADEEFWCALPPCHCIQCFPS